MIDLKLLEIIEKQLQKAKKLLAESIIIFRGLFLIIMMRDFYQFLPVIGLLLWANFQIKIEIHGQIL